MSADIRDEMSLTVQTKTHWVFLENCQEHSVIQNKLIHL